MSFGNIFRKMSIDLEKQDPDPTTSGPAQQTEVSGVNIFAAPGKLLDSVNTKTGQLVSDLNQRLDLGKRLGNLRQASLIKFDHVVHGGSSMVKSGEPARTEHGENCGHPSPKLGSPTSISSSSTDQESSTSTLRRQSTESSSRPPRPPPPSPAALSRAVSLDEAALSSKGQKHTKLTETVSTFNKLDPALELDEDRNTGWQRSGEETLKEDSDSSASEYGRGGDMPVYKPEPDVLVNAPIQPSSVDYSQHQESGLSDVATAGPTKTMLETFVSALIQGRWDEVNSRETELQDILGTAPGRMAFVNLLEQKSTEAQGRISSSAVESLLRELDYLLVECQNAEDFSPAKKLLTTSLLYKVEDYPGSPDGEVLFTLIKNRPIWQSLRFWNACFFQSIQEARAKTAVQTERDKESDKTCYDQLKSYLKTMNVFGLHETIQQEFLRKQSSLFNLTDDEVQSLWTVIEDSS
ncbi:unnamed protein product [Dicrocoelium dendriticum]|nr:unnamed protein product [Dicrocoelium dendriticum]